MKKMIAILLIMVLCLTALAGCGGGGSDQGGSGEEEVYTFKHGFDLDYPPYSYLQDDGTVGGFDVELAQAVCEYLGWKYEAVPFNWDAKDAELNAGSCDCIWSGFTKEGREDDYVWGIVYSKNTQGILVAKDSGITSLADLEGKIVGVQTSTSAYDMLQEDRAELKDSFAALEVYETYTIAYNDLKAGAIDAIAIDMTAGTFLKSNDSANGGNYVFLDETLGEESYAIGFRKGDEELAKTVSEAVKELVKNGTYAEIGAKYPDIQDYLYLTPENVDDAF